MRRALKVALAFLSGGVLVVLLFYLATGIFEAIYRVSGSGAVATIGSSFIAAAIFLATFSVLGRPRSG